MYIPQHLQNSGFLHSISGRADFSFLQNRRGKTTPVLLFLKLDSDTIPLMNTIPPSNLPLRVMGIVGSLRPGSFSRMATTLALEGAREFGAQTELLDLNDFDLPFCDGKKPDHLLPANVIHLRETVRSAQGIILATPQYHGSFSGVLKNALDLMGFTEFEGKMIGLVGVAGGSTGAMDALNSLRAIGRALHAWVVPEQVSIAESHHQFNSDGSVKDPRLDARLREVGHQVAKYAWLHSSEKFMEFLELYERAPFNPGAAGENQEQT